MPRNVLRGSFLILFGVTGLAHGEVTRAFDHMVIDGVKIPFGTDVELTGPWRPTGFLEPDRGYATMLLARVNGRANQDEISVKLDREYSRSDMVRERLLELKSGDYLRVRGRLMNGRALGSDRRIALLVDQVQKVKDQPVTLSDFIGREGVFEGKAQADGLLETHGELARIEGVSVWPTFVQNMPISVRGVIRRDPSTGRFRLEKPRWGLVELADQIGRDVSLDGVLYSFNSGWQFTYRTEGVYLTTKSGERLSFESKDEKRSNDHGRRVRVTGQLVRENRAPLPRIGDGDEMGLDDRPPKGKIPPSYVIRGAKVEYLEGPSSHQEKYGAVPLSFNRVTDGVPELLARGVWQKNPWGGMSTARRYALGNKEAIALIVHKATPATRVVLARRMDDSNVSEPLRLLYAALLASLNDERGRAFLIVRAKAEQHESLADLVFCLGAFPSLASDETDIKTELQWAEETLISLMTSRKPAKVEEMPTVFRTAGDFPTRGGKVDKTFRVADAVVVYSAIPSVLWAINSKRAHEALVDYSLTDGCYPGTMIQNLSGPASKQLEAEIKEARRP